MFMEELFMSFASYFTSKKRTEWSWFRLHCFMWRTRDIHLISMNRHPDLDSLIVCIMYIWFFGTFSCSQVSDENIWLFELKSESLYRQLKTLATWFSIIIFQTLTQCSGRRQDVIKPLHKYDSFSVDRSKLQTTLGDVKIDISFLILIRWSNTAEMCYCPMGISLSYKCPLSLNLRMSK